MADALTNNLSLTLPQVGSDGGTWGTILNGNTFTPIDSIFGGQFTTVITSADVTLTTTQFQNAVFTVSGTLTGNHSLILPISPNLAGTAVGGKFIVVNNGAGAFNLSVKTAATGSLGVTVPQGFAASLYSDTVNVGYASNGLPGFASAVSGNPNGQLAGTAGSVNTNAQTAYDYTNGVFYLCTTSGTAGSAIWSQPTFVVPRGFDMPVNLSFTTSVAVNSLTITAVASNTGTTPTITNPIIFPFRSATLANGAATTVNATAALAIQIFSSATLGAVNGVPFRGWIVAGNNAGTVNLGVINCSNANGVFALNETGVANSQAMTAGATSTGVFYTPANATWSSAAFRIVGFFSYETALVTAGTYNNAPDVVQLFGPGVKKPGDVVQTKYVTTTTVKNITSATKTSLNLSSSITVTSNANSFAVSAGGYVVGGATNHDVAFRVFRNSGAVGVGSITRVVGNGANNWGGSISSIGFDGPASSNWPPTEYNLYGAVDTASTGTINWLDVSGVGNGLPSGISASGIGQLTIQEIMG